MNEDFEAFLDMLGKSIIHRESKPAILNPEKVRVIYDVKNILDNITKGIGIKISVVSSELMHSTKSIRILGKKIVFSDTLKFVEVCNMADAIDIHARTDGFTEFEFGFNDVTLPIEGVI